MKLVDGIWLPDGELHFPQWWNTPRNKEFINGKATYQIRKLREAMRWCKQFNNAVDVGAHVGLWSMHLAEKFDTVYAFEPMRVFRECFGRNVEQENTVLYPYSLGNCDADVAMVYDPADSGGTHVGGDGDVKMRTLDSFAFDDVGFIKIDCEGYELQVLQGAVETLKRCRPCVIVEQKPHKLLANFGVKGAPAVDFLRGMGAVLRKEMGGDYIMSFD